MTTRAFQKIYTKIDNITKATVTLRASGVGNDELATVGGKLAQVVKIMGENVTLQVFAGTDWQLRTPECRLHGEPPGNCASRTTWPAASSTCLRRAARRRGRPSRARSARSEARTVNPFKRIQPSELIATGIAGIDLNNTIVTGQKIPFFADPDQPYNAVMANVALRAKADKIILGGMGLNERRLPLLQVGLRERRYAGPHRLVRQYDREPASSGCSYRIMAPHGRRVLRRGQGREGAGAAHGHDPMPMRWPSSRTVWTRFPRKDSMPGSLYSTWRRSTKAVQAQRRIDHDHRRDDPRAATSRARHPPTTRVTSPRASCSCATPTRARSSWTRSVRCRV